MTRHLSAFAVACLLNWICASSTAADIRQPDYHNRSLSLGCCLIISHAGGSYQGWNYSNSLEALDANFAIGRRIFEIDFSLTSDGALALVHDWAYWNGKKPDDGGIDVPDEDRFLSRKLPHGLSPMTLPNLDAWLDWHPDALIVTDTKEDFADFAEVFFSQPVDHRRFIFQVYSFDDLDRLRTHAKDAKTILTLYRLKIDTSDLIAGLPDSGIDALTMPLKRTAEDLPRLRAALPNLPIYVHGQPQRINATQLHFYLRDLGASGFYLD